jgi:hypothetical protein
VDVGAAEVCVVMALGAHMLSLDGLVQKLKPIMGFYFELYKSIGYMCHDQKLAYIYKLSWGMVVNPFS